MSRIGLGLIFLAQEQLAADPGREAVAPRRLDQQPARRAIAGFGEAATSDAGAARLFARHQSEI